MLHQITTTELSIWSVFLLSLGVFIGYLIGLQDGRIEGLKFHVVKTEGEIQS